MILKIIFRIRDSLRHKNNDNFISPLILSTIFQRIHTKTWTKIILHKKTIHENIQINYKQFNSTS